MSSKQVFRQSALDRLSAPEELDKMVRVTDRRGWIALIALVALVVAGIIWSIFGSIPIMMRGSGIIYRENGLELYAATQNGNVSDLKVKVGDKVQPGQVLAVLNTAQGPQNLTSTVAGTVVETPARKDTAVEAGGTIVKVEQDGKPLKAMILMPLVEGKRLQTGVKVQITPSNVRVQEHGYLLGKITAVSPLPVTPESLFDELKSRELVQALASGGPAIRADVELEPDPGTVTGLKWSTQKGPPFQISSGTLFLVDIVLGEQKPISLVLPIFGGESR